MIQTVISLVTLLSVVQAAKYSYNEGSAAGCGLPVGTNYAQCGPNYWHQVAGFELCENTDVSTQTPIDFSNVEMDASLEHPEFEIEDEGCEVSVHVSFQCFQSPLDVSFRLSMQVQMIMHMKLDFLKKDAPI